MFIKIHIGVVVLKILFRLKFHWSSQLHPHAFGTTRTPIECGRNQRSFDLWWYFRSRPQGEAMSVSFQLLIEDYNDLNTLEQCKLMFITTNREQKSLFLLWRWSEFLLSSLPLIKAGVYHIDPVWWQIVGGSQWSIMNSFYTIVYIIFNNYIIKLKRQLW